MKTYAAVPLIALAVLSGGTSCSGDTGPDKAASVAPGQPTSPSPSAVSPNTCRVTHVSDGDTIKAQCGTAAAITVRIIGIDTPETVDPRKPVQCYGPEASTRAHQLLDGKSVRLYVDPTQDRLDRYGRTLAYVSIRGRDYGERMLRDGYAREYLYRKPYLKRPIYVSAQATAKADRKGLWGSC